MAGLYLKRHEYDHMHLYVERDTSDIIRTLSLQIPVEISLGGRLYYALGPVQINLELAYISFLNWNSIFENYKRGVYTSLEIAYVP